MNRKLLYIIIAVAIAAALGGWALIAQLAGSGCPT